MILGGKMSTCMTQMELVVFLRKQGMVEEDAKLIEGNQLSNSHVKINQCSLQLHSDFYMELYNYGLAISYIYVRSHLSIFLMREQRWVQDLERSGWSYNQMNNFYLIKDSLFDTCPYTYYLHCVVSQLTISVELGTCET